MSKKPVKLLTLLQQLSADKFAADCIKYPSTPPEYIPTTKYTDTKANGLTKAILAKLHLDGWQAERINRLPRPIDGRTTVTDVAGRTKVIGSVQFIKSGGTNGSSDLSSTIAGRSVKIEIKIADSQSEAQTDYQRDVERAGGIYLIARSYDNFLEQYLPITQ